MVILKAQTSFTTYSIYGLHCRRLTWIRAIPNSNTHGPLILP